MLRASPSIDSIFKSMPLAAKDHFEQRHRGTPRPPGVKVDVIAEHGRRWIRVNTVKNARLLAEFREIDSYLTDSEDEAYEESEDARPTLAQKEFDNSVLRMGRSLIAAAIFNPIEGSMEVPRITLRLTRLDPSPNNDKENDSRISQTIRCLQDMGITVELGERQREELPTPVTVKPSPPVPLEPTIHLNLDLSVLIALISDLTHSPLPKTVEEANARFIPPKAHSEWKKKKNSAPFGKKNAKAIVAEPMDSESIDGDAGDIPSDLAKHSRAVANQLLREMGKGLLQEIHDKISILVPVTSGAAKVKFWTTTEARDRCLRIISKIGGPREKRRAHAIFHSVSSILPDVLSSAQAEEAYWQDSRYPFQFLPLFPINLFLSLSEPDVTIMPEARSPPLPQFLRALAKTCKDILALETIPDPRQLPETVVYDRSRTDGHGEIQRAIITKANPRLTAHTVQSLLWGAELGWTTMTANKTSVRAILREIKLARVAGRLDGSVEGSSVAEIESYEDNKAAIWIVDPRSLAESISSRTE